ncbi:hypothetical protein ADK86_10980 [Streptomyces sp. NRRL F-5755]|nr:hypothetical protein ADK86_10980 [Streptomyces sp. NRRL F-5755]
MFAARPVQLREQQAARTEQAAAVPFGQVGAHAQPAAAATAANQPLVSESTFTATSPGKT